MRFFNQFELADGSSGWAANPRQPDAATWSRPKCCVRNKVVVVAPVVVTHVTHVTFMAHVPRITTVQGGITCGAIDEPRKSSKAIDERVIINFRDKNVVIAHFRDKTAYVWMGILPLKKRVNRDKCSFATKQRMFGVFAIDEILRYRGTQFPGSRTLCHPGCSSSMEAPIKNQ